MTTDKQESPSLTTQGKGMPENSAPPQTIIPTGKFAAGGIIPSSIRAAIEPNCSAHCDEVDGGAEGILRTNIDGTTHDVLRQQLVESELRRQTVQAEAMVNLAVGVTLLGLGHLADIHGKSRGWKVIMTPEDLAEFQQGYTVEQQIAEDGGFIITVTPKEV